MNWKSALTWFCRLAVGITFIFSGCSKGIDPWGTLYLMEDYIGVLGLNINSELILVADFLLFIMEFMVGICILLGCFRRSAPIVLTAIMAFMLPLTLWIALKNPVPDCGCFGQALIISNWSTFWKNVMLMAMSIWLLKYNASRRCLIKPLAQWMEMVLAGSFILGLGLIGYNYQPLLDFRSYKIGSTLFDISDDEADQADYDNDESESYTFVYEKDGVRKEFSIDDVLPDEADGWKFIERKIIPGSANQPATETIVKEGDKTLRVWDEAGETDITHQIADYDGNRLYLMMPDLNKVSIAITYKINSLYSWAVKNDIDMVGIVNGSEEEIANWKDISLAEYPLYTSEDTAIKEVVRGNPGLVYTENGNIIWKRTLKSIDVDDFMSPDVEVVAKNFIHDNDRLLINISLFFVALTAVLIMVSYSPTMARFFFKKEPKSQLPK